MPRPRPAGPVLKQRAGIWFVEWWEDGRRRRLSTRLEDPIGAKQFLADFEAEAERRPVKLTVAEALDRYEASRVGKVEALVRAGMAWDTPYSGGAYADAEREAREAGRGVWGWRCERAEVWRAEH